MRRQTPEPTTACTRAAPRRRRTHPRASRRPCHAQVPAVPSPPQAHVQTDARRPDALRRRVLDRRDRESHDQTRVRQSPRRVHHVTRTESEPHSLLCLLLLTPLLLPLLQVHHVCDRERAVADGDHRHRRPRAPGPSAHSERQDRERDASRTHRAQRRTAHTHPPPPPPHLPLRFRRQAHVMNDETQRKFLQSVKRLMTYAQKVRPADGPSQMVS